MDPVTPGNTPAFLSTLHKTLSCGCAKVPGRWCASVSLAHTLPLRHRLLFTVSWSFTWCRVPARFPVESCPPRAARRLLTASSPLLSHLSRWLLPSFTYCVSAAPQASPRALGLASTSSPTNSLQIPESEPRRQ